MVKDLTLVLGGARSGKSTYAESLAKAAEGSVLFVATAQAFDSEMEARIARHQQERPAHWHTLESPLNIGLNIRTALSQQPYDLVLVDCLTLLASNVLLALPEDCSQEEVNAAVLDEVKALLDVYDESDASWVMVSNEVGMGVVPPTRLGRFFRDALGYANQRIAQHASSVVLLVAGLPWELKR